jgi:hypothetical protein
METYGRSKGSSGIELLYKLLHNPYDRTIMPPFYKSENQKMEPFPGNSPFL